MRKLIFVTHPEVTVDPQIDVRRWRLSDAGLARMRVFAESTVVANVTSIWSSAEAKAIEAAGILAARFGAGVQVDAELGENDRTATGFVPPQEFEKLADAFFAEPEKSVRGWERAIDAQCRIEKAAGRILAQESDGDVAVVAHGAVGTLLLCSYLKQPISRAADQPYQGHYWLASLPDLEVLHPWLPIAPRGG
ncbi:histidine phosphatase family protein [Hwanghaeella grinnelliae]|uniref:Histidine phosphatase family protein n=1 Tax=Hwanghaeella grinnelliae TaxID=2500179 RepID=A0A3S2Y268_9PROT|nr:histidine phosphatase family protein [Hwanghaeella grinnelliae]RVU35989.1 histidine phosphatase family protein [Hwanghaeella grinnelliae]